MSKPVVDHDMPAEIDFRKGVRGLHHIPEDAKVFMPASLERSVWEYFAAQAERKGIGLRDLLTQVLQREMETGEALK